MQYTTRNIIWYGLQSIRKWILRGDIQERVKGIFEEIGINHGFEIDTMEVAQDHVHIFLSFPPRYSISKVAKIMKSVSAQGKFICNVAINTRLNDHSANKKRKSGSSAPGKAVEPPSESVRRQLDSEASGPPYN